MMATDGRHNRKGFFYYYLLAFFVVFFRGASFVLSSGEGLDLETKRDERDSVLVFFWFFFGLLVGFVWQSTGLMCRFK